jgi:outer membrane protein assembly factor BamB/fructose-specific component phosphotransferase system IIB-like protein
MSQSNTKSVVIAISAAIVIGGLCLSEAYAQADPSTAGAPSKPTSAPAAKVVGWRGDGTGRYPDANPPTEWYLKENGESKNILWKTKLPCYSWATPIIVGDKVFTRSEPYDLICLDKNTGKLLWIRSHPPIIAVTDEQKKANPAFKEIDPLVVNLQKVNDEFVAKGWSKELYKTKYDLQKKINEMTAKADEKYALPPDQYVESWSGYTGSTPCSDGQFIYICAGDGITACYDLDGNRKWAKYESLAGIWGEHGSVCSPAVVGDRLLISTTNVYALDKASGTDLWKNPKAANGWSILPLKAGETDFVVTNGTFFRVSDGKDFFSCSGGTMTMQDSVVYITSAQWWTGFYKFEAAGKDELKVTPLITDEYQRMALPYPAEKTRWEPMVNNYTACPLYHNGLVYCLGNWGRLIVLDTTKTSIKDGLVYNTIVPFDFKNPQSRKSLGMGIGASPIFAGKHIYMIDSAGCMIVMAPGREYKQVAKNNIDYTVPEGWEPTHWTGPHHEQFEGSPIVDGNHIYLRGEQFLYCIGEK